MEPYMKSRSGSNIEVEATQRKLFKTMKEAGKASARAGEEVENKIVASILILFVLTIDW